MQTLQQVLGDAARPADAEPARVDEDRAARTAHARRRPCATASFSTLSSVSIDRSHENSAERASAARLMAASESGDS